ncbi:MAG: hypothetical protein QOE33_1955 [Acidobacteriota bacterium]|nr:hypothetical protein [Acidobacteriota bacterium]
MQAHVCHAYRSKTMHDLSSTPSAGRFGEHERDACLLLHGIKSLLRCDEAEVVEGIARYVVSQHKSLRAGSEFIERKRDTPIPATFALLGGLSSFLEVSGRNGRDGAVWIARLGNERGALEKLPTLLPELNWTELEFRRRPAAATLHALSRVRPRMLRRVLRLAHRLHGRYEFFKVLRVVQLIAYYARYLAIFRSGRFRLALMSSHSNPHGIAFNVAARKCGVPVVLVTHGMPVRPVAPLSYDLALVHCEAARQIYVEEGCRMGRVLLHGRRQSYAPMSARGPSQHLRVGIFLCKDVNEERLRALAKRLLGNKRVSCVVVRPHPKNLWMGLDEWIASSNDPRLQRSTGHSVFRDMEATDIVLAGNSSVLVDAVTAGLPCAYVRGIDHGPPDLHAFVARGLIYPMNDDLEFDPTAMFSFYQRRDWADVLRLFANIDEDETSVANRFGDALRDLSGAREMR